MVEEQNRSDWNHVEDVLTGYEEYDMSVGFAQYFYAIRVLANVMIVTNNTLNHPQVANHSAEETGTENE